ncbi:MAG: hypothetical protein OEY55_12010 [Acidimicrobiia bacterium]|nr:hypothetical protein [Acidimicrobiia bacterium]
MEIKQILALNSVIWATAMLAVAFILKGETRFLEILLVLICGVVASNGIISRSDRR